MSTRGWQHVTLADVTKRELARQRVRLPQKPRSKYGAVKTAIDGYTFDSKREAEHYLGLMALGLSGYLRNLELQPAFPIYVSRIDTCDLQQEPPAHVATYIADFRYERRVIDRRGEHWVDVIEDVKGMKTPVYRLKKKLVEAIYGFQIQEV